MSAMTRTLVKRIVIGYGSIVTRVSVADKIVSSSNFCVSAKLAAQVRMSVCR
jgi:hypothetical protein